jgi:hypothetical protein
MAEANKILKAPPLNKTRDWKPPPRFKTVLTLLTSSAEAGVLAKATPKWSAPQKEVLSVRHDKVAVVQALTVTNNLQSYTVSERNRIKQAMELAEKLGYPSAGMMIEFINSGTMNNLPVTAQDAARAYAACGAPIPLIQGKDSSYC